MSLRSDPVQQHRLNACDRDPEAADVLLRKAYRNLADETGIRQPWADPMQQGMVDQAERAYRLALQSDEQRSTKCRKNLGFLLLWRENIKRAGIGIVSVLRES